jgi:RNA polymerase sigma-70 factor, ECF subfamily
MVKELKNQEAQKFERLFSPHLDAAYNLARWLTSSDVGAQDVVQESCLRAYRSLPRFIEDNPRAWLLKIVRNQSYTWLSAAAAETARMDSELDLADVSADPQVNPETLMIRAEDTELLRQAIEKLPALFREVVVMKDFENVPYAQIAEIVGTPIGTVMSRLSRARKQLKTILVKSYDNKR